MNKARLTKIGARRLALSDEYINTEVRYDYIENGNANLIWISGGMVLGMNLEVNDGLILEEDHVE